MASLLAVLHDKMDFGTLMIRKDDFIFSAGIYLKKILVFFDIRLWHVRRKMHTLVKEGQGESLYIILNGPSLKKQDLTVLEGKRTVFVNRGFMHSDYELLKPEYHVFVDKKMISGVWPLEWIDTIFKMSPQTKIVFPIEWYTIPKFNKYHNDDRFIWLPWHVPFKSLGVSGSCFSLGVFLKYSNIYFTGFDANGIAYEMLNKSDSHFYGEDPELKGRNAEGFSLALYLHSRQLHDLTRLSSYLAKKKIRVFNMTEGGMLDMFERVNMLPLVSENT